MIMIITTMIMIIIDHLELILVAAGHLVAPQGEEHVPHLDDNTVMMIIVILYSSNVVLLIL